MEYNLELDKVCMFIKEKKARLVCIQLPDGLKPKVAQIKEQIEKNTDAEVLIWLGSCFGACDMPENISKLNIDLLIQWGHSGWNY